ncbi:DinB family protein [Hamadaea tsunoensis]|uniref:DinB family protein n=1 Tax=Hamadaea tsunoensis TaxID=53368 RepID=UPI00040CA59E|nr:DinB family protein [Hamadaea tsunoensis]
MELSEATAVLAGTPAVLEALLARLPDGWARRDDGPGTWSAYAILGHLRHGDATNWLPRTRMILNEGTARGFEPFDREAMLRTAPVPVTALLAEFAEARRASLAELAALNLTTPDLVRRGRHPEFGEVTLGQLIASWVAHDLTHIGQASEVLARHYREDVGPWRAYMPALNGTAPAE